MRWRARVLSALLALAACSAAPSPPERPNVLLIVVDTLRADYLGAYGFPYSTSPEIDRLATEGVVFERAIAAAPSTVPAHASIMTSKHVRELGVGFANADVRFTDAGRLAHAFRDAGYATAAFVGNFFLHRRFGFADGFDVFDDELDSRERMRTVKERGAEATTRRALDWIAEDRDRPFFAWVHYQDPHGPYEAPPPFAGRIQLPQAPGSRPLRVLHGDSGLRGIPRYQAIEGLRLPSDYRSRYADEIRYADHWIGRLLAAVEGHGSGRAHVVLLTADHGESLGEEERYFVHGFGTAPQLAHVPFLLRAPGLYPGRHAGLVGHVDVMPTLLELAGIERQGELRGIALGAFLRERRPLPDRFVICDRGREISAYRGDGWLRVRGIPQEAGAPPGAAEASWERYAWNGGASWTLVASDVPPDPELREFLRTAEGVEPEAPDEEVLEQLHSMGYLVD